MQENKNDKLEKLLYFLIDELYSTKSKNRGMELLSEWKEHTDLRVPVNRQQVLRELMKCPHCGSEAIGYDRSKCGGGYWCS